MKITRLIAIMVLVVVHAATVNAQARTETVRTVLPRYVLLHVQWKFNFKPTPAAKLRKWRGA